ncbi:hypothetical protein EJ08DRAFT_612861 [Tothia fuscella]|uniref:chitin synthase n=1 Tax=Tothia fuscella TaxID=1048955 RepID=A0A9P4NQC9_9PEZI|nr:hypothetical protein EJ08DRAFT_612861 [Tothia fuscella]
MDHNNNRLSTMSSLSSAPRPAGNSQSAQVSTQTLLNAVHTNHLNSLPHSLEPSTSLVVNTWLTAINLNPEGRLGGIVDTELSRKAWEHARRRAEDGCIILGSLHPGTPAMMAPFASSLPIQVPGAFYCALEVIKGFTHCVTPQNPSAPQYSSLAATFNLSIGVGEILGASLALSKSGLDMRRGLLHVPQEPGHRAFNAFYYLDISSATPAEREFLNLGPISSYSLLQSSGTFSPPHYIPTADDAAAAEDFRANLRAIGVRGDSLRRLICALTGLLKLGNTLDFMVDSGVLDSVCEEVSVLLDVDYNVLRQKLDTREREVMIGGIYEAILDWVIARANETIRDEIRGLREAAIGGSPDEDEDSVSITVVCIPGQELGKAVAMRNVFDDSEGINAEMKEDGVTVTPAGTSVLKEMSSAVTLCEPDLSIMDGPLGRELEHQRDTREGVLEKVAQECEDGTFLKDVLHPIQGQGVVLGSVGRFDLASTISSSRVWFQLCLHPTDDGPASLVGSSGSHWSAGSVSAQLRAWRLPEWANRRNKALDFTADFDLSEFVERYSRLGCQDGKDGVQTWLIERGWSNGEVVVGHDRVWMREAAWWEAETLLEVLPPPNLAGGLESGYSAQSPGMNSSYFPNAGDTPTGSHDNLLARHQSTHTFGEKSRLSLAPSAMQKAQRPGDYGLGNKGDNYKGDITYDMDESMTDGKHLVEQTISKKRKIWIFVVWALTWWIPSPLLKYVGRMKRPDVRMAWREKVVLIFFIFLLNLLIVFYIIEFGRLLCPNFDKAWNSKEVSYHQGDNDFYVSHGGHVYDLSKWWSFDHSDSNIPASKENMQPFAGTNVDAIIRPPLNVACPGYVTNDRLTLIQNATETGDLTVGQHISGPEVQTDQTTKLHREDWYQKVFLPKMATMYKGDLVWDSKAIKSRASTDDKMWFTLGNKVYDLTLYFYNTGTANKGNKAYQFLPTVVTEAIQSNLGQDLTSEVAKWNTTTQRKTLQCFNNMFYVGQVDFRKSVKCQVNNYLLLAFTIILCAVILTKFLAALQLGSKRRPAQQEKFVICQVPAYTEGEDQLRKGLDSLTALAYDNKRKLICVICDGMIVGGGNDRPTPKIVLDILGVDPKIDPPALPFKSVGAGSEQLNYGKVYSGLYEFEGNVVPYIVVVKVGKESEQAKSKPGNRGKRDSQILVMSFLNRVHHRSPMSPLELEMFHQINNIIGVDPELYEYIFMVDADTSVKEDALNRLVAACANDAKIAGICGETSLENEERSWWTMIQVYEYYISHHLAKAFESLFGSVTCLPGCFCMYRLRTADKGKPLIISDAVISEYADGFVDTLHKKNLLSLGEDRYLTTLMTKHFPHMSYKFVPSALALTAAPETWSVLLSQRRRWINSTIHNLAELVFLKDMCGFCCFSMRFVVFIDLFGTIILPATCAYLAYLLYRVGTHTGQFPLISIIMLASVYGLQAVIFIIKRQWQHIGWMVIYILAFPIYSFVLPIYSFWKQDDFSWGNTRIVVGESGDKQVIAVEDEGFDPRSIPLQRWDDYAAVNGLGGRRGGPGTEKGEGSYDYEMDDARSQYSSYPAASILTGFPNQQHQSMHMPPQPHMQRQSTFSNYNMQPQQSNDRLMSMGGMSDQMQMQHQNNPYGRQSMAPSYDNLMMGTSRHSLAGSTPNLLGASHSNPSQPRLRSPLGHNSTLGVGALGMGAGGASRPVSTAPVNFMEGPKQGPSDEEIISTLRGLLQTVNLDTVTKKQIKLLTEQRLQTQLTGERKAFLNDQIDVELAAME